MRVSLEFVSSYFFFQNQIILQLKRSGRSGIRAENKFLLLSSPGSRTPGQAPVPWQLKTAAKWLLAHPLVLGWSRGELHGLVWSMCYCCWPWQGQAWAQADFWQLVVSQLQGSYIPDIPVWGWGTHMVMKLRPGLKTWTHTSPTKQSLLPVLEDTKSELRGVEMALHKINWLFSWTFPPCWNTKYSYVVYINKIHLFLNLLMLFRIGTGVIHVGLTGWWKGVARSFRENSYKKN